MRRFFLFLVLVLLGFVLSSCADSGPTELEMLEILESLETSVNEKDLEGVMALFADDAIVEESFEEDSSKNMFASGTQNIEFTWEVYFITPVASEFRDISVDGDTATFTWIEFRPAFTKLWPTNIEVENGKITHIDWYEEPFYEDPVIVPAGEE